MSFSFSFAEILRVFVVVPKIPAGGNLGHGESRCFFKAKEQLIAGYLSLSGPTARERCTLNEDSPTLLPSIH